MEKSLLIFLLFCFLSPKKGSAINFLRPSVETGDICWQSFQDPLPFEQSVYSSWPKITDIKIPLPKETKRRILLHPKVQDLRALYKKGEGLSFDFSYIGLKPLHKGEHIQRAFLIKILKFLFPKARIITRSYKTRFDTLYPFREAERIHVSLEIRDVRESEKFENEEDFEKYLSIHKNIVDMILLKRANSSQKEISEDYKKSFPSFEKKTVLSLYLPEIYLHYTYNEKYPTPTLTKRMDNYGYEERGAGYVNLFQILDEFLALGFRKVFLTSHFNLPLTEIQRDHFLSQLSQHFDKILFLSQVSQQELFQIQEEEKVLFFNDRTGYTSVLHSLADTAFILGPINILEGIFLGAKLIFMNEHHALNTKYQPAFEQLKQTALGTNRAISIKRLNEAKEALQTLDQLALKPLVYPDEVKLPGEESALDQLMDRLHFQITESALLK